MYNYYSLIFSLFFIFLFFTKGWGDDDKTLNDNVYLIWESTTVQDSERVIAAVHSIMRPCFIALNVTLGAGCSVVNTLLMLLVFWLTGLDEHS